MRRFKKSVYFGGTRSRFSRALKIRRTQPRRSTVSTNLTFERLEPRLQMAVVINEFLAANTNGILDQDSDRSDWIELRNDGASDVNIGGWYLTDDMSDLEKWQIPSTVVPGGEYLVIFASGKDRADSGQELHTNFSLEKNGESLVLVMPDGISIADSFDPYPEQENDVSYGRGQSNLVAEPLIAEVADVRVKVPTSDVDNTDANNKNWTELGFLDESWLSGETAIGYERDLNPNPNYNNYFNFDVNSLMPSSPAPRDNIYLRIPFSVFDIGALQTLDLQIRYDDAFVAYLNGQEIARSSNAPANPDWDSLITTNHSDSQAVQLISFPVSEHLDKLVDGENVLAIHGINSSNNRTDFLNGPKLVADRATGGIEGYMVTPTPGAPNAQGTLGFVADTAFSVDRGFYDSPFNVAITTATPDATIRYTLDGSAPTATTGLVYNAASPPLISKTTNLRAAAYKTGYTPTNVDTQTYIFLDQVLQQNGVGLPPYAPWGKDINNPVPDWDMDPDVVNNPLYSGTIKNDLQAVPTVSLVLPWNDWFGPSGQGIYISGVSIERRGSIELFNASGSENFQLDAALEIQGGGVGGTSANRWKSDKLSIRVTFKQPGPTKLDYELFSNPFFDEGATSNFDTFLLDAQLNYTWIHGTDSNQRANAKYIQDQFVADLQNFAGGQAPHGKFVHLYLNGLYWGMYTLHERPDDSFAEAYLGGDKDDYDVLKHTANTVVSGATTAIDNYAAMLNLVRQNMTVPANYEAVKQKLEIDDFIDYMIVNYYVGNTDWAHKNWYATFNRVDPNGRWRFHSWDAEHVLKDLNQNSTNITNSGLGAPTEIFHLLSVNPEFRLRFADHVQGLFYNGGLLTPAGATAVYTARMQEVDRAIVGESARWGDNRTTSSEPPGAGNPYTRDHWLDTQNDLLTNYFPLRTNVVLNQFASRGWTVPLAAPLMNQYGGTVTPTSELILSKSPGAPSGAKIYYTLDGSDPRDSNNNLPSSSAILYSGSPITFADGLSKQVQARIYLDDPPSSTVDEWSPLVDQTFLQATPFPLRITELNYHPAISEDHEFIELMNTGIETVSLEGVEITQFASEPVVFGAGISLAAGERIIVAKDPAAFQSQYGPGYNLLPTGYGTANLSNSGEQIILLGPVGETLQIINYSDSDPWPSAADGDGPSLEIIDPLGDPSDPANWRASFYVGGSPGASGITGDFDGNGLVETADHGVWASSFGNSVAVGTSGDGNRSGVVDLADYIVWRKAMNTPLAAAAVATIESAGGVARQSVTISNISPVEPPAEVSITKQTTTALPAIDDAFTRFLAVRPGYRPLMSRPFKSVSHKDDLLLMSLANDAATGVASDTGVAIDRARADEGPIDELLAEWTGVAAHAELF